MNKLFCTMIALVWTLVAQAQPQEVEMADGMRSEGKIYVVVGILLIITAGLLAYLVSIDRKTARLEEKYPEKKAP